MKTMKFFAFVVAACMLLAGCSQSAPQEEGFSIGILQYMEHTSLDEIRTAVEEELQQKATELGKPISVEVKNAQGDPTNIGTIANQFVGDNKDLIIAIATPAAAGAAAVTEEIPIVFSAVTNPVEDLQIDSLEQPGGNITGTSDAIPVEKSSMCHRKLLHKQTAMEFCTVPVNPAALEWFNKQKRHWNSKAKPL